MSGLDNDPPAGYVTPPFPSLYWLIGPRGKVKPIYLYNTSDVWRFTLFWTLIVFEAAHLAVGFYAVTVVWWGGRNQRVGLGMGRKKGLATGGEDSSGGRGEEKQKGEPAQGSQAGVKNTGISGMWAVPVFYGLIAGVEGVFAGSVVGLLCVNLCRCHT